MRHNFTIMALVGLVLGVRNFLGYLNRRTARPSDSLQSWESEGGAVPVASNRTAAQVEPHEVPDTKP